MAIRMARRVFYLSILNSSLITRRTAGLGISQLLAASGTDHGSTDPLTERAHALMKAKFEEQKFMGVAVIAVNGSPIFEKSFGWADLEWEVPQTPLAIFRLGALTKTFTAAAILQLAQKGSLQIEGAIGSHVQDLPKAWQHITLHQLMTHSSGIANYTSQPGFWSQVVMKPNTPQELVGVVKDKPLEFEPGKRWGYSNTNYVLLGMVIEQVSGMKYCDYLQQNILGPLDLKNTGYDLGRAVLKHRARGYATSSGGIVNAGYIDMSVPYSASGVHSTVNDMLRWDQALYTDKLLSKTWRDRMFSGHVTTPVNNSSYGYGWFIGKQNGRTLHTHEGNFPGFATMMSRYPESRTCIILLSNLATPHIGKMGDDLADIVFGVKGA
ncbi:MAG: serine hydrolase domain-containing protein [Bryobacteraceae bacterium]